MRNMIYVLLSVFALLSCTQQGFFNSNNNNNSGQEYGSLNIVSGGNQNKCVYIDESRSIVMEDITAASITVSGNNMTDITVNTSSITSGGSSSNVTINNIPVGKNRVVTIQAKKNSTDMDGIIIRGVVDINTGSNSAMITWTTTPLGNVFYKLLKTHGYNISGMNSALKTQIESVISGTTVSHPSFLNTDQIASDVNSSALKAANHSSYIKTGYSVTFSLKNITDFTNLKAQVNDPASSAIIGTNILTGTNTINNITPGNWEFVLSLNGGVVHRSSITFTSGSAVLGELELMVAKPSFSIENSSFAKDSTISVELTSTTGADIYYTTNGSEPTNVVSGTNFKYSGTAISISETTTLKAKGFKTNYISSLTSVKTYTESVSAAIGSNHPATGSYSQVDFANWGSAAYPLGSYFTSGAGSDATFAVYSKNATAVLLEIYDENIKSDAKYDYWMTKGSDNIWRAKLASIPDKTLYAFRVWGPNWTYNASWTRGNSAVGFLSDCDTLGNRFNPNKVVYDPYGREMSHDKENPTMVAAGHDGGMYGTGGTDTDASHVYKTINRRNYDTGKWASKSVLFADSTSFGTKPAIPQKDAIIYEAHARGLTKHPSSVNLSTILNGITGFESVVSVPDQYRGTYKGASYMAKYLKALGFNTIELLPVHETANDVNPDDKAGGNYWGYMTYGFFAPDRRYAYDKSYGGATKEFKEMVKAFHDEGLEVYLDVVYNHTGEGGSWDGTAKCTEITCFRGFDNSEYYQLVKIYEREAEGLIGYQNDSGCGNNFFATHTPGRNLVIDSLTYWVDVMGVDGCRFDLAPILGREGTYPQTGGEHKQKTEDGKTYHWYEAYWFTNSSSTLTSIATLAANKNAEMIAEAWDCSGSQVGNFPSGWGEWNGFYRDAVRRFIKGTGTSSAFNGAFYGSYDSFNDQGGPHKSVNFIVAHDGYTLMDLVSYDSKTNVKDVSPAWPFGPSDGGNGDDAWGCGGDQSLRRQQLRNLWTIQMFSRGVPMSVYGDELCRTQNGNVNPYNVDSVATWNNYNMINTDSPNTVSTGGGGAYDNNFGTDGKADGKNNLFMFVKEVTKIRNNHYSLRQNDYSVGMTFKKENGTTDLISTDKCVWIRIDGSSKGDHDFLLFINSHTATVSYTIPAPDTGKKWVLRIATGNWAENVNNFWSDETGGVKTSADTWNVNAREVVVFEEMPVSGTETVAIPEFNLATGVYSSTQSLSLTSATSGATIKYTLDGTDPATSGTAISGTAPVSVSLTATGGNGKGGYQIRAIATKSGFNNSPVDERRYAITAPYTISTTFGSDVMLQGFHWDSCKTRVTVPKHWYVIMNDNATEIRNNFQWVWFPPATAAADGPRSGYREGYMPTQLNVLDSDYGTEAELKTAIASIYNSGTAGQSAKAIADIVINHRCGSTTWADFTNPTMGIDTTNGYYKAITYGDNLFSYATSPQKDWPSEKRGWGDTGADFDSARDLDHTNITVQSDIVEWMNTKLKSAGFKGWRYDYVKGFDGKYVGYYNSKTSPEISIGELWEDTITQTGHDNWVNASTSGGTKSMVFDFDTKAKLNSAFGWFKDSTDRGSDYTSNDIYPKLSVLKSGYGTPAGYIGWHPENAITFVDNHDTGSTQQHWELNNDKVYLAYVYTLTHPGVPCVAWDHYFDWTTYTDYFGSYNSTAISTLKDHIKSLINIRKTNGITNTSSIVIDKAEDTEYAARIGNAIAVKIGTGLSYNPGTGWAIIYSGTDFCIWKKSSEIVVKNDGGTEIVNSGNYGFGEVENGQYLEKTFTIANDGLLSLNISGNITVSGTNASCFTITQPASTTIATGNSTTFKIKFTPGSVGDKNAVITIPNNDLDESSYTINLTGKGIAAGLVATPTFTYTLTSGNGDTQPLQLDVTIDCATAGASIYYTTNGDIPTTSSYLYSAPIKIGNADTNGGVTTLKAIAVKNLYTDSSVASQVFVKTVIKVTEDTFSTMLNFKGDTAPLDWTASSGTGNAKWSTGNVWYYISWKFAQGATINYKYLRRNGTGGGAWANGGNKSGTSGSTIDYGTGAGFGTWSDPGY